MKHSFWIISLMCLLLSGAGPGAVNFAQSASTPVQVSYDFRGGSLGWQAGFAEYILALEHNAMLRAEVRELPSELGVSGTGFYLQSMNRSDDTFMFLKRRLGPADGIVPWQRYRLNFTILLASNAPSGCGGIGGPPGESVYLKAGATSIEPLSISARMNVDKGQQSVGGPAASSAGDIANGLPCDGGQVPYTSITRTHQHSVDVSANGRGDLWLLVGTDSGFEGFTGLYFQRIAVNLEAVGEPTPSPPALLTEGSTERALALDSLTFTGAPFPLVHTHNFAPDRRTRVSLFASNAELRPGEDNSVITVTATDAQAMNYPLKVEYVGEVPVTTWIAQIVVKLPEELVGGEDLLITVNLRGAISKRVVISTKQ
jgi:hypothetical protein